MVRGAGVRGRGQSNSNYPAGQRKHQFHQISRHRLVLGENRFRFLMRETKVKVVLGPQGSHVKDVKSKCADGCKIVIYTQHADGSPFPVKSPDRVLNIECSLEDLEVAIANITPHLQVAPPDLMVNKFNEVKLLVPEFVCSTIIGKQGMNVKSIQKELKSFVQVHRDPLPHSTEYVVTVTNRDVDLLATSVKYIFESIHAIKSISHVTMFNPISWSPGEFGDTGSFSEEIHYHHHAESRDSYSESYSEETESHEKRYYREQPRFSDDYKYRSDEFNESHYQEERPAVRSRGRGRGRSSYRGQQHGASRGSYHRGGSNFSGYKPRRNHEETEGYQSEKEVTRNSQCEDEEREEMPRRPRGSRGRGGRGGIRGSPHYR